MNDAVKTIKLIFIEKLDSKTINDSVDMTLFKDIQNTWDERQTQNGVKVKIPVSEAIAKSADNNFTDQ